MFVPIILPWMKQPFGLFRDWIDARKIRPFQQIAKLAREREVFQVVPAAMLCRNDVLDMERAVRLVLLFESAIFATVAGARPDLLPQGWPHAALASFF